MVSLGHTAQAPTLLTVCCDQSTPTVFGFAEVMVTECGGLKMVSLGHKEQEQILMMMRRDKSTPMVFGFV